MPEPTVEQVTTDEQWDEAVPILRQLWSHESEDFVRSWREEEDYELYGYYAEDGSGESDDADRDLVAVAGLSVQRVLHHRRHAWVHDFVVDEAYRGEGHGAALLEWIEQWAAERDCEYVALANVLDNDEAREFYEANGMETWGYVVETELE
ncbi:Acetyltransferase (GNAT) family protein [Halomicrobium zhouii]|uniref:Acetyltransferase (GNAT) family protein n=1 Tax=Halomicrobium zhouii TaxID=767519 RepID=A0A1I6LDH1_9EURY|nr:GNAT family N-acetyltransferase [Halomicrobium zhouii]SFS01541.1 Acetyltransferase (GNAT) family protein [Halomicrobium zhouii]